MEHWLRLAGEPEILLLDEPTNHLDVRARQWLESFLRESPEGVLIVCHDRSVINAVADRVLELERGSLTEYAGGFDDMRTAKSQQAQRQLGAWQRHRDEDRRLRMAAEDEFQRAAKVTNKPTSRTYDPKSKAFYAGKQAKMDQRAKAIRSRVEKGREGAQISRSSKTAALKFPCKPLRGFEVLTARGLRKSYGGRSLFDNLNLTLHRGSRIAVVGPNGCGKTTLFLMLLGEEPSDAGEIFWAPSSQVAVLSQGRDALRMDVPAIEALKARTSEDAEFARTALARLGMRRDMTAPPLGCAGRALVSQNIA